MADLTIKVNDKAADNAYKASVGEKLTFSVVTSEGIVEDPRWHISGPEVCSNFQMTSDRSTKTLGTMGHSEKISWCISYAGQAVVRVKATVEGKTLETALTITISAPEVIDFSAITDDIHVGIVDSEYSEEGSLYLTFGGLKSTKKPGIAWTAKLIGDSIQAGSYAFVQLMKIRRQRSFKGKVLKDFGGSSGEEWVLDEDVFYGTSEGTDPAFGQSDGESEDFVTAQWPRESTLIKGEDSPATPLFQKMPTVERLKFDEVEVEEYFRTHLMFKPKASGSIWVSIARLDWFWKAHAKFENDAWRIVHRQFKANPIVTKEYDLPAWSNNRNKILRV